MDTTEPTADTTSHNQPQNLNFRPPSTSPATAPFKPPTEEWLHGKWYVKQSSLPMWKSKRNVIVTYAPLNEPTGGFDNLVEYQALDSNGVSTIKGIERPHPTTEAAWNWRGKGWLKIATSQWEVSGWGEDEGGWMVIYFQKTLFTPAGVDLLTRRKEVMSEALVKSIRATIKAVEDENFGKCADDMFDVKHDL